MQNNAVPEKTESYDDQFDEYLADITLEIQGLITKASKNDTDGMMDHWARIHNIFLEIKHAQLDPLSRKQNDTNDDPLT